MPMLLSIRVAEPWTTVAILVFVVLVVAVIGLTVWLISRS
jgi:hypothetical protein